MPFAIILTFRPDAASAIKQHRLAHLTYIRDTIDALLVGGPITTDDGAPIEDIIILRTDKREDADAWVRSEPFSASGAVFSKVTIHPYRQVVPDLTPGALEGAIAAAASPA